eukprot:CAMPEP_0172390058 /NCGR_PEP_ID=MMETSP1061-20121228/6817_1 /TAXON_ID=37318 /ORGANISM="Pseudo-nitzschia pungens, Strain cf. pungens" /LENGTH=79 /DNA_ID=CAMNT_0013120347 /DNA_START=45 /DNA_END=282 /DNA_ORIENTATION=-
MKAVPVGSWIYGWDPDGDSISSSYSVLNDFDDGEVGGDRAGEHEHEDEGGGGSDDADGDHGDGDGDGIGLNDWDDKAPS